MKSETTITVFPLMGCVAVERASPNRTDTTAQEARQEAGTARGSAVKNAQKRGKTLLRDTAKATPQDDYCYRLIRRNRAVQSHLIYFCGAVRYALFNHWRIAYGEYTVRLSRDALKGFHTALRDWARKYLKDTVSAISLGVGAKGIVCVYFVTTAEDALTVHDTALRLARYLRKKKFIPVLLRPYEKDPLSFLRWKYCNEEVRDIEEVLRGDLWLECWEVMRAGFSLPYCHRTLRNEKTTDLITSQADIIPAADNQIAENGVEAVERYNDTLSAFVTYKGQ